MNTFPLGELYFALDALTPLTLSLEREKRNAVIPDHAKETVRNFLKTFETFCKAAGLDSPLYQVKRLEMILERSDGKENDFVNEFNDFKKRLKDELSSPMFMVIPKKDVHYYTKTNLFGEDVFNNFASANFDIEEAGKCFATSRYTASVMHLQRVLEVGLKAYGNYLGVMNLITTSQPSWNLVLDQTRKEIKERNDKQNTSKNWTSNEERDFCENIQPFLEAVKTAWRNPSMHADKVYGEEIAADIGNAVKRFMKHLAEHLNETGNFIP